MERVSHYLGDHKSLVLTVRGDRMYVDTRDIMISPGLLCWGSWEPETTKTLEQVLKPGMVWADIGANIGYFTVIGHKLVRKGGGKTFAFEANPPTFDLLVDNVRLNWFFEGVVCEQKAVYSETTKIKFGAPKKYAVNASIGEADSADWSGARDIITTTLVDAVSVDHYFSDIPLDFIKADVEGAEAFVLSGAKEVLKRNRAINLLIEWSPNQMFKCKSGPKQLVDLIREYGFHTWLAESNRNKISLDELLNIKNTTMIFLSRDEHFAFL